MAKAACVLFLLLSTAVPSCDAARVREDIGSEEMQSESEDKWGFSCPSGLRANATEELCYYDGVIAPDESAEYGPPICSDVFEGRISDAPLALDSPAHGGTFMFERQFSSEMAKAMAKQSLLDTIANELMDIEMKQNASFAKYVHDFMENVHHLGHNYKPAEFLVVHAGLHVALEVAVHGLEVVAHAGLHGAMAGVAEGLVFAIPIVGLALFPIMAAYDSYTMYHHYKRKGHHAKHFAHRLVLKADCANERIKIAKTDAERSGFVSNKVADVCGHEMQSMMAKQIQRANVKLHLFLNATAEMGRCLYPHGERSWAKTNCAHAAHMPLREEGGKSGLIWMSLSIAAAYGDSTDQLLSTPTYGSVFEHRYGVSMNRTNTTLNMLNDLAKKNVSDRAIGCMSILATQRAFERTFTRLSVAVKVWSRTYARDLRHRDMRMLTYSAPCRRVFQKLEATSSWEDATCKDEQFLDGHGENETAISEVHPCADEETLDFPEHFGTMLWPEGEEGHH